MIKDICLTIGFFFLTYSLVKGFSMAQPGDGAALKRVLVKALTLTALMAFCPTIGQLATGAADDIANQINSVAGQSASAPQKSGVPSNFTLSDKCGAKICASAKGWVSITGTGADALAFCNFELVISMVVAFIGVIICDFVLIFLYTFRGIATALSLATLPLGIALMAVGSLANIGQKWITGLVAIMLWPVGFSIMNMFIVPVLNAATASNASLDSYLAGVFSNLLMFLVLIIGAMLYVASIKIVSGAVSGAGDMGGGMVGTALSIPFKAAGATAAAGAAVTMTAIKMSSVGAKAARDASKVAKL